MFSCGLTQELDPLSSPKYKAQSPQKTAENSPPPTKRGFCFRSMAPSKWKSNLYDSNVCVFFFVEINVNTSTGHKRQEVSVDALMARMRTLSQKQDECSESELNQRFKSVEMQVCALKMSINRSNWH